MGKMFSRNITANIVTETVGSLYDSVSNLYEKSFGDFSIRSKEWKWLKKKIESLSVTSMLDVGCGNGSFLDISKDYYKKALGFDISKKQIEYARQRKLHHCDFVHTASQWPSPDSYDFITSLFSFRYFQPEIFREECRKRLIKNGTLIIIDTAKYKPKFYEYPGLILNTIFSILFFMKNRRYIKLLRSSQSWRQLSLIENSYSSYELKKIWEELFLNAQITIISKGLKNCVMALFYRNSF